MSPDGVVLNGNPPLGPTSDATSIFEVNSQVGKGREGIVNLLGLGSTGAGSASRDNPQQDNQHCHEAKEDVGCYCHSDHPETFSLQPCSALSVIIRSFHVLPAIHFYDKSIFIAYEINDVRSYRRLSAKSVT